MLPTLIVKRLLIGWVIAIAWPLTAAHAGCILEGVGVTRQLTDADKASITSSAANGDDITTCDVSGITDMSSMFTAVSGFNQDISGWDTSNVVNMDRMFLNADAFNQPIGNWDTSNVTNMSYMFSEARNFNQIIGGWNTSNVMDMSYMFENADVFNQDIGGWDTSNVADMYMMFGGADVFNQDIGGWDTSNVQNMDYMFAYAGNFNHDIGWWDTSNVSVMRFMFLQATNFNQDIGRWNTSRVLYTIGMFQGAINFNQEIRGWDVGNVRSFTDMFRNAQAFRASFSADATPSASFFTLPNSTPTADAGSDQTVASTAAVTLDGSGSSDADSGDTLTYAWTQTSGTTVTLSSATVQQPTFTAPTLNVGDADAVLVFSLVVNDSTVNSAADTVTITVAAPTNSAPVADAGSDQTVASAATVTLDGSGSSDADAGDTLSYAWTQSSGTTVALSSATAQQPTFTAPTLNVGDADAVLVFSLVVNDSTVNSAADTVTITVAAPAPTPASEFAEHEEEIRNMLFGDASRSLRSSVAANRRLTQSARNRFVEFRQIQAREEEVTRALIPFDVDGNFTLSESGLSTAGNFFQQVGNEEGTYRRLFFGDFDVQHDADTDSTTATLTGRMAWEQMTSEQTMLGYFIGGELATSTIGGSFEGDQDRIGVTAGGYVVQELAEQVYFDGFVSLGAGRNNLEMANDTLALESEYTTQTATLGVAITGVYSQKGYDFKPELAFSYGKTWLGDVGFTGRAYGLVENTLSLDAGDVSIASLTFRPEVIVPIGADFVADSNTQFTYAPRLVCEQTKSTIKTSDCGTGGELGFSSTSEDGLSSADMRILLDRINGGTRSSFAFSIEHKF